MVNDSFICLEFLKRPSYQNWPTEAVTTKAKTYLNRIVSGIWSSSTALYQLFYQLFNQFVIAFQKLLSKPPPKIKSPSTDLNINEKNTPCAPVTPATPCASTLVSEVSKPVVPPPIGLKNEGGTDCFMNALRQLSFNIPILKKNVLCKLPKEQFSEIHLDIKRYEEAQTLGKGEPLGGSLAWRKTLGIDTKRQEDIREPLMTLVDLALSPQPIQEDFPLSPYTVKAPICEPACWIQSRRQFKLENYEELSASSQARINKEGWIAPFYEPKGVLTFPLKGLLNISFETILENWGYSEISTDEGTYRVDLKSGLSKNCSFTAERNVFFDLPQTFLFTLNRFESHFGKEGKDNRIVDLKETFVVNDSLVRTKKNGRYRIKGFAYHLGKSTGFGHYVAYIKVGKTWFLCNDSSIRAVEQREVTEALRKGYLFFAELEEEISSEAAEKIYKQRQKETFELESKLAEKESDTESDTVLVT